MNDHENPWVNDCENPQLGVQFFNIVWQQAAAQGMSVFVSSGDSGSATCDSANAVAATSGLGVNGWASTPYNVAVGGTRFNDNATYWNRTNNIFALSSARGYIPETVWNDRMDFRLPEGLWSSGGGVSVFWPKPSWQVGLGVPPPIPALPLSIIVICPIYHSLLRFTVGTLSDMLVILNLLGERRPPVPPLLGSWQ